MDSIDIRNRKRASDIEPRPCGRGARTLLLASIGTSSPRGELGVELDKARLAQDMGADAVTDHSFYGDLAEFHSALVTNLSILVSTVGCYEFAARHRGIFYDAEHGAKAIDVLQEQAERGVDIITVHASLKRDHLEILSRSSRMIPMTSKGGGIVSAFMRQSGRENPYYENFDQILDIFADYQVTLSLGTSLRPATVCDHFDELTALELQTMAELVARAAGKGVNVMVEGIGHAAIDEIPRYVQTAKRVCHGVPYRVLPVSTDIALGFDHISGAIAAATAVAAGADAVTCISRSEHIGLPSIDDLKEAIIASRIAAHSGELAKLKDYTKDEQMSVTRWQQGCKGDWTAAIVPVEAEEALRVRGRLNDQLIQCSMCGAYCGIAAGINTTKAMGSPYQGSRGGT